MLVLSRKVGNRLVIAGEIEITVVQIRGNRVRLGINAPPQVSINRFEAMHKSDEAHSTQAMFHSQTVPLPARF